LAVAELDSLFTTFIRRVLADFGFSLRSAISIRIISLSLACDRFNNIITKGIMERTPMLTLECRVGGSKYAKACRKMAHLVLLLRQGATVKEKETDWPVAGETHRENKKETPNFVH
jgi:hypothetical protein